MNVSRSSTITVSPSEVIDAIRQAFPENLDIQALPLTGKGVSFDLTKGVVTIIHVRS